MDEQNNQNKDLDTKIENFESESSEKFDYDFLKDSEPAKDPEDIVTDQFDLAFKKSSPVIQNYITSEKLEENIKLIAKIEKLDDEKSIVIIENIAVSLLVGLLPISEAKETIVESFRSSGVLLESITAGMILKNIDAYILSDVRKQILESKIENSPKEIRHLTLKEQNEEKEKEELRKILLERTGNLTGKGEVLVQYKNREVKEIKDEVNQKGEDRKPVLNRESLLEKINIKDISDTEKIKERMLQIKKEEEERLKKEEILNQKDEKERIERIQNTEKLESIEDKDDTQPEILEGTPIDLSKKVAEALKEKLESHEDKGIDLEALRKKREEEEKQQPINTAYSRMMKDENITENVSTIEDHFDPYRESI